WQVDRDRGPYSRACCGRGGSKRGPRFKHGARPRRRFGYFVRGARGALAERSPRAFTTVRRPVGLNSASSFVDRPHRNDSHIFSHFNLRSRRSRVPQSAEARSTACWKAWRPLTRVKVKVELSWICQSNAELMVLLSDQDKQP